MVTAPHRITLFLMADRFIEVPDWARPADPRPLPRSAPAAAAVAAPEAVQIPRRAPRWTITLPGKAPIPVLGLGLVGRNPAAASGERVDHRVSVGEGEKSVSKTHLAFGVDGTGLWVEDRHSTNGTTVIDLNGRAIRCEPAERVYVESGGGVRCGDVEIRVESTTD